MADLRDDDVRTHSSNNIRCDAERIIVNADCVIRSLLAVVLGLSVLSVVGQIAKHMLGFPTLLGFVPFTYVDLENNLPTWFQTLALALAAILVTLIGVISRRRRTPYATHWLVLAAFFALLSLDEAASVHERTMEPLTRITGSLPNFFQASWVVLGTVIVIAVITAFRRFYLHFSPKDRRQVALAVLVYFGGALIMEMIPGALYETSDPSHKEKLGYVVLVHIEEIMEMLGLMIFIDFSLRHLMQLGPVVFASRGNHDDPQKN